MGSFWDGCIGDSFCGNSDGNSEPFALSFHREMQTMQCTIKETSIIRGLLENVENFCNQAEAFLKMDDADDTIPLEKLKVTQPH